MTAFLHHPFIMLLMLAYSIVSALGWIAIAFSSCKYQTRIIMVWVDIFTICYWIYIIFKL